MNASELWTLLDTLEAQLPLERDRLEALFEVTFETTEDHNKELALVARTPHLELELSPARGAYQGHLTVRFSDRIAVGETAVIRRFPGGSSLPPPPPGIGPEGAQGAYIANRPWGRIWFAFYTGDRLGHFSISPGVRGSPGV